MEEVQHEKNGGKARMYDGTRRHKKGYCVRGYKGIDLQSITQIVVSNLNKKVKTIVNCDNIAELIEKSYKNRDISQYEKELKINEKQLEKCNKLISSLYKDY